MECDWSSDVCSSDLHARQHSIGLWLRTHLQHTTLE